MVFDEDWAYITSTYGISSPNPIGAGEMCKSMIHAYVRALKAKAIRRIDEAEPAELQSLLQV
jgi:hypothetical protein